MNLLSLLGVVFASGTLTLGTPQFRNNDTYQDVEVTTTYEYETNEVNSSDDLVDGNIYHFSTVDNTIGDTIYDYIDSGTSFTFDAVVFNVVFETLPGSEWYSDETIAQPYFYIYSAGSSYTYAFPFAELSDGNYQIMCLDNYAQAIQFEFDFIYHYPPDMVNILCTHGFIYESSYLGDEITTITPIETSGLYNIFYQFLNDRIFTGGYMDSMTSSVLGQTLTLGNWCSIATSIVCLALVLFVFIKLLIFLFKVVGGLFLWR